MASGKRIIEAFASSQIKFKVTRFNWISEFLPYYTDLNFEFIFKDQKYNGRGTAQSEELALIKAAAEAIERCVCAQYKIHTNGVAFHFDIDAAKLNARNELIERDLALCHYLTQTPFQHLKDEIPHFLNGAIQKFSNTHVNISLFKMKTVGNLKPVICLAEGNNAPVPFGLIIGLGCKESLHSAIESAFLECAKNVVYILHSNQVDTLSECDFESIKAIPNNHFLYALNPMTHLALAPLLEDSKKNKTIFVEAINNDFQFEILKSDFLNLGINFYIVRAQNPSLQNIFYGKTKNEYVNLDRLSLFSGKQLSFNELYRAPHIFG